MTAERLFFHTITPEGGKLVTVHRSMGPKKGGVIMAGIFTRGELDKIIRNAELTEEQKT